MPSGRRSGWGFSAAVERHLRRSITILDTGSMRRRYRVDLAGHMAECDANYARLLKLAPDTRRSGAERRFVLPRPQGGYMSVRIAVIEVQRYTSTLRIQFHVPDPEAGARPLERQEAAAAVAGARAGAAREARGGARRRARELAEVLRAAAAEWPAGQPEPAPEGAARALLAPPPMVVRLYHDARSAEILDLEGRGQLDGRYAYPNRNMHQPDEKAQQNRFLAEFLGISLELGVAVPTLRRGAPAGSRDTPWRRDRSTAGR